MRGRIVLIADRNALEERYRHSYLLTGVDNLLGGIAQVASSDLGRQVGTFQPVAPSGRRPFNPVACYVAQQRPQATMERVPHLLVVDSIPPRLPNVVGIIR